MPTRCIAGLLAGAALGAWGARVRHTGLASSSGGSKQLAGVPLLNYELAYSGRVAQKHEKEHWIVVTKPSVSTAKVEELCRSAKVCERTGHPSEGGVPFFEIYSTEQELEHVLALAPGQMEFVEPDGKASLDPEERVETTWAQSWGLDRVGAPNRFATGEGAHIYVLDTGIRISHLDFGNRASTAIDVSSGTLRECNGEANCGNDRNGHGTHCAGTAGGAEFGVASGAKLYACKVLGDGGVGDYSWSWVALDWLATKATRPTISSMSIDGFLPIPQEAARVAVDAAVAAGVVVVIAAGNWRRDACSEALAFVPSAVTVGSTNGLDQRSSFSNFGSCVDLWAPGSDIVSAGHQTDTQTLSDSGTSMACPHVSGAAALVLGENPGKSPAEVLAELIERSEKGAIFDQQAGDVNFLLWVGSGPAPVPAPMPPPPPATTQPPVPDCPSFAAHRTPNQLGLCECAEGHCSTDGRWWWKCSGVILSLLHPRSFFPTCDECRCYSGFPFRPRLLG